MKRIFPALVLAIGVYWVYKGVTVYRIWASGRLGGGFMPAFAGAMAMVFALVVMLEKDDGKKGGEAFKFKAFLPVLAVALVIAASYLVGLVASLALFILLWLCWYEKYSFGKSAATAIATGVVIYVVFVHWLLLPFPRGLLDIV